MTAETLQSKTRLPLGLLAAALVLLCLTITDARAFVPKGVKVSVQSSATGIPAGGTVTLTASILDAAGAVVSDATDEIAFACEPEGAGRFSAVRKAAAGGVATVTFTAAISGTVKLSAWTDLDHSGAPNGLETGSATITVRTPAVKVSLRAIQTSVAARTPVTLVATLQDKDSKTVQDATAPVSFSVIPAGSGTFAPATQTPVKGVATIVFTPTRAGRLSVTASADLDGNGTVAASEKSGAVLVTIAPGPLARVLVTPEKSFLLADGASTMNVKAQLRDADGNFLLSDNTSRIAFTATGDQGRIVKPDTVTAVGGEASVVLQSTSTLAGMISVQASVVGTSIRGPAPPVRAIGGTATSFRLDPPPKQIAADAAPVLIRVVMKDSAGNTAESDRLVRVSFRVGTAGVGSLSDTAVTVTRGVAQTKYTPLKVGSDQLTASVAGMPSQTASIAVVPGAAKKISLTPQSLTIVANGTATTRLTIKAEDSKGNLVTSDTSTVALAGTVEPSVKLRSGAFSATVKAGTVAGPIVVTASAAKLEGATVTINAVPGAAAKIALSSAAGTVPSDGSSSVALTARIQDANGNAISSDSTSVVKFRVTAGAGAITAPDSVRARGGVATAALTATENGAITVSATAGSLTAGSVSVTAVTGGAAKVTVVASKDSVVAGGDSTISLTATIRDARNHIIVSDSSSYVKFSVSGPGAIVGADSVRVAAGVATAVLSASDEGAVVVTASSGSLAAGAKTIQGLPKAAVKIVVSTSVSSLPANGKSSTTVTARIVDANGNLASTDSRTIITLALSPGAGGVLDSSAVKAVGGIASVRLTAGVVDNPPVTLTVTASAPAAAKLASGSAAVALVRPLLDRIRLTASAVVGGSATVTATVLDTLGNAATADTSTTIAFTVLSGQASVSPATKVTASGVATATITISGASGRALVVASARGLVEDAVAVKIPVSGVRATDDIPPAPASNVIADTSSTPGKVTVRWTASPDDRVVATYPYGGFVLPIRGVARYDVYRKKQSDGTCTLVGAANPTEVSLVDNGALLGVSYAYTVVAADADNEVVALVRTGGSADLGRIATLPSLGYKIVALPALVRLSQNHPNPFNPETTIDYGLPTTSPVRLCVYNSIGQLVRVLVDAVQPAGFHAAVWDGRDQIGRGVPSGTYFYRLTAGSYSQVKRMLLVK